MTIHARIKAVKDSITEQGSTANEELILECADQAGNDLETAFLYIIADTAPFNLEAIEAANPNVANRNDLSWFVKLNNRLTELLFWQKSNPTQENRLRVERFWEKDIPNVKEQRFEIHAFRTL